ncbi:MAG: PAS domain-containing protein [Nocardioidaceae bacterium]|nr:PAS domain-containing protein [Nocardioidaceae bacterium]
MTFGLGFYAGVPLTTQDGHNLEPREVTDDEMATLRDLAAVVMDELELRLSSQKTIGLEAELRRAAEEMLVSIRDNRQSTEKLEGIQRTLLEHMPDGVVMLGADETIVACNPAAEALLGFRAAELVGCSVGLLRERCLAPNGRPWGPSPTPMMATMRTGVPQRHQIIGVPNPPGAPRCLAEYVR